MVKTWLIKSMKFWIMLNYFQNKSEVLYKLLDGERKGVAGLNLKNLVVIGIGGSYLAIEFVYEALRNKYPNERKLRFLANVDPIDFARATEGLDPKETMFLVNSKTFTTAETMLNARTARKWLIDNLKGFLLIKRI